MGLKELTSWGGNSQKEGSLPYHSYQFAVQIDGVAEMGFQEVSGLRMESTPYTYREGGNNMTEIKLVGDVSFPDIILKKGITDDYGIWNWVYTMTQLETNLFIKPNYRRDVSIILLGKDKQPKKMWTVYGAIPVNFNVSTLSGTANEICFETIVLAHQGFDAVPLIF